MKKWCSKAIALTLSLLLILTGLPVVGVFAAYENTHTNTGNQAEDIIAIAKTQVGYLEGSLAGTTAGNNNYTKYGVWYANNYEGGSSAFSHGAWCAMFVSWCANQAGIPSSIVYPHAYCPTGVNWFKNQGLFKYSASRGGSYTPKAGDIIYFAPSGSSTSSHVGLVRYSSGGYVYTIEGNTSGQNGEVNDGGGCFAKSYSLSYSRIYGYGTPAYQDNSGHKIVFQSNGGSSVASQTVKDGEKVTKPSDPTRYAFEFAGWYCNPELTDPYDFNTPVPYGFTLYAKWNEAYWGANTNLMPTESGLKYNSYDDNGGRIYAYWNNGIVDMYTGVDGWAWPSAYMTYENSVDSGNDAYIYVKKDGTAYFNATITYLDRNGASHDVTLSELAGNGTDDFAPGYDEFFVNFGQYVYDQGHLTDSGNVKITKCSYFVVGEKDQYVKLYDMKFTPAFAIDAPYTSLYGAGDYSQGGVAGSYTYDNGVLYMSSTDNGDYSVTIPVDKNFNPSILSHLLMDVSSTTDFNITLNLTNAKGDVSVEIRNEFFNEFDLTSAPKALPAGTWKPDMNLKGYYEWNGGATDSSTVKSITITLYGKGDLSLSALQASRKTDIVYVTDGQHASGTLQYTPDPSPTALTSSVLTISDSIVSRIPAGTTVSKLLASFDQDASYLAVYNKDGQRITSGTITTGMTLSILEGSSVVRSYGLSVIGDITSSGSITTNDVRMVMVVLLNGDSSLTAEQRLAADYNNNGQVDSSDARYMLSYISAASV